MRKLITLSMLCFATVFSSLVSNAQQLPRYTQYMFNKTVQSAENTDGKTAWIHFDCNKSENCLSLNDLLHSEKKSLGLGSYDALLLKKSQTDKLGFTHHRLQQTYKGIPIVGADFLVHTKNEKAKKANGYLVKNLGLNTMPNLSETQALQAALQLLDAEKYAWEDETYEKALQETKADATASFFPKGELVIVSPNGKDIAENYRLAYRFDVYSIEPLKRLNVFVDANNAAIVTAHSLITDGSLACTGETNYSCNNPIHITCDDSNAPNSYALQDDIRNITTYTSNNTNNFPSNIVTESDTHFDSDKTATDVHYNTEQTYEYFLNEHGLDGFDNNHTHIRSWTHFRNNYVNAFWNGSWLTYGDGDGTEYFPLTSLDIVAHEFAHAVTHHSASLVYRYEAGALNESFSDIFGAVLEFYAEGACADWLMGEDVMANGLGFRSMENPHSKAHPDTYGNNDPFWINQSGCTASRWNDYCGVHTNSSVQNYWFYLLSDGGSGTNSNGDSYNVAGIGIDKAADIAFRTLTAYLGSNDGFIDARNGSIQAAEDLYGANSLEVEQVCAAWAAVGVGGCGLMQNETITVVAPNGGEVLNQNDTYTIEWTNTGAISAVDIAYTINGSNYIDIATNVANVGTYTWTVPNVCSELVLISVTDASDVLVSDVSDNFEIVCCEVVAGFTYDDNIVNTPITFSNTSTNATTYEWQIDGVTQSTSLDFTHTFATEANYLVTLIADDGTCTDIYSQMVAIAPPCYNRYVATTGSNNNIGDLNTPYADIQYAITQVCDGDTVFVNDGTYVENIDFLGKNIVVTSINGAAVTTIDGNQNGSVVVFQNGETSAVLDGFTVTNGSGSLAKHLSNSSSYNYGGGILMYLESTPTVQNLIVENNNAERGGGICTIRGWETINFATIKNCEIKNNHSIDSGGGILVIGGGKVNIINSLVAKNHSNLRGGGLKVNYTSEATIVNSTFADNTASSNGGNIARANEAQINATNCIFTGSNNTNIYWSGGALAQSTISYSSIEGGQVGTNITWGAGNIDADPLFADAPNGDYSLQVGSPCIDTGTATDAPSTDINGVSRPQGNGVDMGAYEYGTLSPACNASSLNLPTEVTSCDSTSTTLSANLPNMAFYIWDFEGQNIGTTEEITVTENGWYYLSVADVCGNAAADSIYVLLDDACVWPGDCNYDNIVNYLDLLHWSAAFGQTGTMRPNASFNWNGQPCENWNGSQNDGVNYKHADTDGNGIVDLSDPNAIIQNYSLTHGTPPPPLQIVESPINLTPAINEPSYLSFNGSTDVVIDLDLRNNNNIDVVFNRLGFQVYYNFGGDTLSDIQLELNENWVGTNVKTIVQHFPQEQRIDVAIARYDGQNVTGDGYLGRIIAVIDNVTPFGEISLNLGVGNINGIKMLLNDDTEIPVGFSDTDFEIPVLCPWKVQDALICSSSNTFWVAVNAEQALENCIGAEFNLNLPAGVQTTGNYTFGELALNAVNNDEALLDAFIFGEYVIFSFDGSSPNGTALNGNGTLLYIELENTNAVSGNLEIGINGNIIESYALGYEEVCGDSGTIELETQSGNYGNLYFWNDANNPLTGNTPSITNITPINNANAVITPLDTMGRFGIDGDTQCKLTRHGGCIPLSPIVGGLDANRILSILTNSITPTIEQLLAADVNEDNRVTAGDLTLVAQRSTGNICNYPTQIGQDISDWKFIPTDIFLNNSAYINATKFDVPVPSQIMNFDAVPDSLCYNEKDVVAILKGDVTGNWNSSYAFKTGNLGEIVVDLANISATENNTYQIPIFYDGSENINAIDLNFAFDASQMNILDVVKTQTANDLDIEIDWNIVDENRLYFMAFSLNEITANTPLFYLEVQTLNSDISANLFNETHVYLNELETDISFSTNNSVGIFAASNVENSFSIYPNPAKDKALIYVNETAKATTFYLYDIAGKKVGSYDVAAHTTQLEIDLQDINAGLYLLEWQSNDGVLGKQKLVVIK